MIDDISASGKRNALRFPRNRIALQHLRFEPPATAERKSPFGRFSFFLIEGVQSWPTKKMSTRSKVSLASSSSSYIAPYRRGGKLLGRSEPELPDQIDSQSGSAPNSYCFIVSPFDLDLSIVNSSANGEKPSLCKSVSVQGAEF